MIRVNPCLVITFIMTFASCQQARFDTPPNVILIMADDMGYECLGCYGGTSYPTPVLDEMAANGIRFNQCISQPLCTPSRVKIMTGLYNYRNYDYFGHLADKEYTFGNLMKEAGYTTCIVGKWQLNGLAYKDQIPYWNDQSRPHHFGFDEYCLWQLTRQRKEAERFANPLLEQNGETLPRNEDLYGPDVFRDFILDFIDRNKDQPFFIYYPMVLVHEPFVPTPLTEAWREPSRRYEKDTSYFRDMMIYTDLIVGDILKKLDESGLINNTLVLFTADNGTDRQIYSQTREGVVHGGKGKTTDAGTHVPMIASWPAKIKKASVYDGLIEFSDFLPTLAELTGKMLPADGKSFYPLLTGEKHTFRETAFVHYDPRWGNWVNQFKNRFVRTNDYKLYQDGRFFHIAEDLLETDPLPTDSLNDHEANLKSFLEKELARHPPWDQAD